MRFSAFRHTDPAFEPSLRQDQSPLPGNGILRGRDKGTETASEIQSITCRDKTRPRIPPVRGYSGASREISVCTRLRGGAGRTRTSNQTIISRVLLSIEQRVRLWGFPGQRRARSVGVARSAGKILTLPTDKLGNHEYILRLGGLLN
jgi:hypothetical protein